MLSAQTVGILEGLSYASGIAYPEGGLLFTYQFAASQAHSRLRGDLQASLNGTAQSDYSELAEEDLSELARFLQGSQGHYTEQGPEGRAVESARALVNHLRRDLCFDLIGLSVEDGGTDMTATLEMARRSNNSYFSLELWWSVD